MAAYPVLRLDQTVMSAEQQPALWSSAMTYKFVGVLRSLAEPNPHQAMAIGVGLGAGLFMELARKLLTRSRRYQAFIASGRRGFATGFCVDALLLPSPYAFSFGGFVNLPTSLWFGAGGVISSLWASWGARRQQDDGLPGRHELDQPDRRRPDRRRRAGGAGPGPGRPGRPGLMR